MNKKDLVKLIDYHRKEAHKASSNLLFEKAHYHVEKVVFYKQKLKEGTK